LEENRAIVRTKEDADSSVRASAWDTLGSSLQPSQRFVVAREISMRFTFAATVCFPLILTGCALTSTAPATPEAGFAIGGNLHGGQQPVSGAHVYMFAADATAYSHASDSLIMADTTAAYPSVSDGTNYYVSTDSSGNFSLANGQYACAAGQQVYLYAVGGDPTTAVANSAAGFMAVLGACQSGGSFTGVTGTVQVNEVTTIAAAYALAGFATDATHVASSGTTLAKTGIASAFANAANLVSLTTGTALATTPAGNGTVPQSTINTLANILAACVNSSGPTSSGCSTLFTNAESSGSTGTTATDTATAAINIAHNSGSNIAALYGNPTPTSPFNPTLGSQPNNFALALSFSGGGMSQTLGVAIDAAGNAWIANYGAAAVAELSSTGAVLSGVNGYTGGGLTSKQEAIAIDREGDAWIPNNASTVTEISPSGAFLSGTDGFYSGVGFASGISIDGSDNVWMSIPSVSSISELSHAGANLAGANGYTGLTDETAVALDGSGNAWVTSESSSSVGKYSSTGTALLGTTGFKGGSLEVPLGIAIDSAGDAWIVNFFGGDITKLSSSGAALSTGYASGSIFAWSVAIDGGGNGWNAGEGGAEEFSSSGALLLLIQVTTNGNVGPNGIAIDGSGDVWYTTSNSSVSEFIGAAVPVITPICAGLPAVATADGTSNLGTEP
jgi:hypothetical protein